jgi:hypothetical protein
VKYHTLNINLSFFYSLKSSIFFIALGLNWAQGWLQTVTFLISASSVAERNTGVSHQCLTEKWYFKKKKNNISEQIKC